MFTSQICFKFESSEWRIRTLDNRDCCCCCCCCCSFPLSRPSVGSNSKRSGIPIFRKDHRWIRDRQVRREELENGPKSGRNIKKLFYLYKLTNICKPKTEIVKFMLLFGIRFKKTSLLNDGKSAYVNCQARRGLYNCF
jgi:hypothetical protein